MGNFFNNGQRMPNIFERARAYEDGNEGYVQQQKPKTNIVVNTNRIGYGKKSTVSEFTAIAYDGTGNKIDSIKGYFLEPETNYNKAKVKNSDASIAQGNYNVISKTELEKRINTERRERGEADIQLTYKWYVDSVLGRSGIAIHSGNYGKDTEGCFLPGDNYSYDKVTETYSVWNSKKKTKELFDFFDNYGHNGIKINVNSE